MPAYQRRQQTIFTTVRSEGAILPMDLLQRITQSDTTINGLTPDAYHLSGEKLNEAINRAWNRLLGAWAAFKAGRGKLPEKETGTTLTRERLLLPLFSELGYGRLLTTKPIDIGDKSYPISHSWQHTPIHLVSFKGDLDRFSKGAGTTSMTRSSPHSLVQELLNRSERHMWGMVSNGLRLRILRDNVSLTRQAYVEFDLEAMMEGEVYADFVLLWLLCHQSRVEAERPESCWLEQWSRTAQEQGTRALDQLRNGVEKAITALGSGFLAHPANTRLREHLRSGTLTAQDYYRQVLRLVYRLLVLFVAEDRNILFHPDADLVACERYTRYYSTARLRRLAEQRVGTRHADLFHALRLVMEQLGSDNGCPELGLPALDSFLFSREAIAALIDCEIANHDLLDAIRSLAFTDDRRLRRTVDYKNLGAEELGSVYESLLELHPVLHIEAATFELQTAGGHERKTTGSYYTPTSLINCLLDSALDPVLDEACAKPDPEAAILNLKVCDPACGSGHFLIAAAHRIAKRLAAIRTGEEEPAPEARRRALRDVVGRCIYGVDINPMAVELCKVSLWMEAIEPGKPLSFLEHHIQCGNSLLGATPALLADGIPDSAFEAIEGDDKEVCREYRKKNKEQQAGVQTLFDPGGEPWMRMGNLGASTEQLKEIVDDTVADIRHKETCHNRLLQSRDYLLSKLWADAWCAAFVWSKTKNRQRTDEVVYPITEEVFRKIEEGTIAPRIYDEIQRLAEQYQFFHWHLAFPDVFRVPTKGEIPENEQAGWSGGFDVVLGNPPWERIKIQEKEWFASRRPDIANAANAAQRRRMISKLMYEDSAIYAAFMEDQRQATGESHFVRDSGRYPLCGRGDINTYAIFAETMRLIIGPKGRVGCIVPSGIATDDTTKFFFQNLMDLKLLTSIYDFENREKLFPAIDSRMKFCLLTLAGPACPVSKGAEFVFFAFKVEDLQDDQRCFTLSSEDIKLLNPNTHTCPIFRSKRDVELTKAIYNRVPVLLKEGSHAENLWGIKLFRMFDMTNDSALFCIREKLEADGWQLEGNVFRKGHQRWMPVFEGKMISMYDHRAANIELHTENALRQQQPVLSSLSDHLNPYFVAMPYLWGPESEGRSRTPKDWKREWFPVFKRVTSVTNERTIVGCVIPWTTISYTLYTVTCSPEYQDILICLMANLWSFIGDYAVRQKTSQPSLPIGVIYEAAFLPPDVFTQASPWCINHSLNVWITKRVLELTYTAWDLEPFAKDCGYYGPPFRWNEDRRFLLRCELDAAYFHLYGIERDDVDYIMETFPIVKRKDEKQYGEYRTKRVILEIYDEMKQAMETGEPYRTRLEPPPADPSVAHAPRERVEV